MVITENLEFCLKGLEIFFASADGQCLFGVSQYLFLNSVIAGYPVSMLVEHRYLVLTLARYLDMLFKKADYSISSIRQIVITVSSLMHTDMIYSQYTYVNISIHS